MTFQFKFSKTTETQLDIDASAIERARLEISDAGFNLFKYATKMKYTYTRSGRTQKRLKSSGLILSKRV